RAGPPHISTKDFKLGTGSAIADFARPPMGLQNCGHKSQSRKNHLISFILVPRFELLAFGQLLVPLLLSSLCTRVIFLRHPFKRSLDILIQVRLLNLGRTAAQCRSERQKAPLLPDAGARWLFALSRIYR